MITMIFALMAPPCLADALDVVNVIAGVSSKYDDNLFRLPAGQDTSALTGRTDRGDRILTSFAGVRVDQPYSLQRFKLDLTWTAYRFQNFDYLDFDAKEYRAAWLWSLTPYLKGTLSADRKQQLNDFRDYRSYTAANIRTTENRVFDADWSPHGNWHLLGGFRQMEQTNSQVFNEESDVKVNGLNAGLKYQFPSGSSVTWMTTVRQGEFTKRALNPGSLLDTGYDEHESEARLEWLVTEKSRVNLRTSYLDRSHDHYDQRDFDGWTGRLEYAWNPVAKVRLNASAARDISSYQTTESNYSQNDSVGLALGYEVSPKVKVNLNGNLYERRYLGDGVVANIGRVDTGSSVMLGADWMPLRNVKLSASVQQNRRQANVAGGDFEGNIAEISAQLMF